mgnify:CR=1 FL=1
MPRPGGPMRVPEKSKDFKESIIRLFNSLGKWKKLLVLSMILALSSAILSTIAPNKLADLTDVVSEGIKPNTENLQLVSETIYGNLLKNYSVNGEALSWSGEIIESSEVKEVNDFDMDSVLKDFNSLSEQHKLDLLTPVEVKGINISSKDQLAFINISSNVDDSMVTEDLLAKLDELPDSIKELVSPKMNKSNLKKRASILAIIYVISAIFGYVQARLMALISNSFAKKLRTDISNKINELPLAYFDKHETGDVLSRVTNDVDTIAQNTNQSLSTLVSSTALFLGSIVMMFVTNAVMALTAILSSILGFLISFILLKKSQKYFVQRQEELGNINGHIEEIYSGHNVVKAYNGEKEALKEFDDINDRLYNCNRKSQFLSGIMHPFMRFIGNFGYVAVCVVGAMLVMKGKTGFGTIVAFMIYVRLFTNPLSQIAQSLTALQSTAAAGERVFEFLDEQEMLNQKDIKGKLSREDAKGNIEFKHVKFGYDSSRTIIKDFSAKVKSGQKIAIVGPTGAGKTTMVNLLMKFYDINGGEIIIDGVSTKDLTRENIHDLFVMVLQDTWLFDGSIEENIRFNKKNISKDEIWKACKVVGIDHFIKTLPGGLDSSVGDNDAISSGQKQLLTIARGMVENAPFLILDEATSNVDTRTEELVQKAMDKLTEGRTSFIIAHRLSTIKNADLILVMDEGNIVEQGTHNELLKKNGFYAKLYNSQFEKTI